MRTDCQGKSSCEGIFRETSRGITLFENEATNRICSGEARAGWHKWFRDGFRGGPQSPNRNPDRSQDGSKDERQAVDGVRGWRRFFGASDDRTELSENPNPLFSGSFPAENVCWRAKRGTSPASGPVFWEATRKPEPLARCANTNERWPFDRTPLVAAGPRVESGTASGVRKPSASSRPRNLAHHDVRTQHGGERRSHVGVRQAPGSRDPPSHLRHVRQGR